MTPAITIGAFAFALAALPLSAAVSSARAEARAAHGRTRQADEATQRIEPETLGTGCKARQVRRRAARQGAAEGVVLRSRRRGYVEGAVQAIACRVVG